VETVIPEVLLDMDIKVEIEAHLMVEEPALWIDRCATAGITAVVGQVEKMSNKLDFIAKAEEAGMRTGLGYGIDTPLDGLEEWVNMVDCVLLLSVVAGAQGQEFDKRVIEKIKKVREMSPSVTVVVDGGLNEESIKRCLEVGGDKMEFAIGSEILNSDYPEQKIIDLQEV
jgi:ribulose-phosphate 3-epimerase